MVSSSWVKCRANPASGALAREVFSEVDLLG
jgi:hypothetical protein